MQIQVNETAARGMAARLRTAAGENVMPQSKAFEVLSQALGFKNWDTLSALLKKKEPAPVGPVLAKPVDLFIVCSAADENYTAPDYCKVSLTQEFVDRMLKLQALCVEQDLSELREWRRVEWGGKDTDLGEDESWRMEMEELAVGKNSMWLSAEPKHGNYRVESRAIEIDKLVQALQTKVSPTDYLVWCEGRLLYEPTADIEYFAQMLRDAGEF